MSVPYEQNMAYELVRELSIKKYDKKKAQSIIELIKDRLNRKFDIRIIITGEAGVGKSTIMLDICELLDMDYVKRPKYAVETKVTYTGVQYLQAMKNAPNLSCLVMDESGQAVHHREFMSDINVILSKTMQGNRFRQFVQIFCIPVLEMIDKDARYLMQLLIHVNARGDAEVFRVIVPKLEGKIWYKKIRDHYHFGKPNYRLWKYYEEKKVAQQTALYDSFIKLLSERDKPELSYKELKNIALDNREACMKGERLNVKMMQVELGVSREKAEVVKAMIEKDDGITI